MKHPVKEDKEFSAWDDIVDIYVAVCQSDYFQLDNVHWRKKKFKDIEAGPNSFYITKAMIKSQFHMKANNSSKQSGIRSLEGS